MWGGPLKKKLPEGPLYHVGMDLSGVDFARPRRVHDGYTGLTYGIHRKKTLVPSYAVLIYLCPGAVFCGPHSATNDP